MRLGWRGRTQPGPSSSHHEPGEADAVPLLRLPHLSQSGLGPGPAAYRASSPDLEADPRFALADEEDGSEDHIQRSDSPLSHLSFSARSRSTDGQHDPASQPLTDTSVPACGAGYMPDPSTQLPMREGTPEPYSIHNSETDTNALLQPPPSYYDVMRPIEKTGFVASLAEFRREFWEHMSGMPQYIPEWTRTGCSNLYHRVRTVYGFLCPRTRIGHMGYMVAGLWLLIVFTGPAFEATSDARYEDELWDWAGSPANLSPPSPFPEDGVVNANTTWSPRGCYTEASASSWSLLTWCHSISEMQLPLTGADVSGHLYFLVDPLPSSSPGNTGASFTPSAKKGNASSTLVAATRDETSPPPPTSHFVSSPPRERDDRGSVRGTLRVVESSPDSKHLSEQPSTARVTIKAKYLIAAEDYFHSSTVAHLTRPSGDQGIGIYTRPARSSESSPDEPPTHGAKKKQRSPLLFDVTVRVPKGSPLQGIEIVTSGMDVILFDTLTSVSPHWRRSTLTAAVADPSLISSFQDDGPLPLAANSLSTSARSRTAMDQKDGPSVDAEAYADALVIRTGLGFIGIGSKLARPLILRDGLELTSKHSSIVLAGQVEAKQGFTLSSQKGGVRLLPHSFLSASAPESQGQLTTRASIVLSHDTYLSADHLNGTADRSIELGRPRSSNQQEGVWIPRSSVHLQAQRDLVAQVRPATDSGPTSLPAKLAARDASPETGPHAHSVQVQAEAMAGQARVTLQDGLAREAVRANVTVRKGHGSVYLGSTFVGTVHVRSPKRPSDSQSLQGPSIDPMPSLLSSSSLVGNTSPASTPGIGPGTGTSFVPLRPLPETQRLLDPALVPGPPLPPWATGLGPGTDWVQLDRTVWRPAGPGEDATLLEAQTNSSSVCLTASGRAEVHFSAP